MPSRIFLLVAVAALAMPLAGAPGPGADAVHHVHMLAMGNVFVFDPPIVLAAAGDTVVFHSHDILHTATAGLTLETEGAEAAAPASLHLNAFDTGTLPGGSTSVVSVPEQGAFPYYCKVGFHRLLGMHGVIVAS